MNNSEHIYRQWIITYMPMLVGGMEQLDDEAQTIHNWMNWSIDQASQRFSTIHIELFRSILVEEILHYYHNVLTPTEK